jgi:hypothetical protein
MTKWFEAPQQKALDAAEEAERRSFRELNPKAARNAATLIGESGLTADDFWSDGKLRQRRYAQVLSGFESTETRGALPSSQGNVFRMELSRDLLLPRVLGRGPALREAYRELVVQKRQLSEREFWQHYVRAKYRLPIAEDDGAAADGDAAAAGAKGGGGGGGGGRARAGASSTDSRAAAAAGGGQAAGAGARRRSGGHKGPSTRLRHRLRRFHFPHIARKTPKSAKMVQNALFPCESEKSQPPYT